MSTTSPIKWNGKQWQDIIGGFDTDGEVRAICVHGDFVYVGGDFTEIGGISANYIAVYDTKGEDLGRRWSALGSNNVNGAVNCIAVAGGEVYIGGEFTIPFKSVAKWTGNTFVDLDGNGLDGSVYAMTAACGCLFIGGNFTNVGSVPLLVNGVARWSLVDKKWLTLSEGWSATDVGVSGGTNTVYALTPLFETNPIKVVGVVVGGDFLTVAGATIDSTYIAKWTTALGGQWTTFSTNTDGVVKCLDTDVENNYVYVGGEFTLIGVPPVSADRVAGYNMNTKTFFPLNDGSNQGTNGAVWAVRVAHGGVFVGGGFTQAASKSIKGIGFWKSNTWSAVGNGISNAVVNDVGVKAIGGC